jgi:serine/threonine transporter
MKTLKAVAARYNATSLILRIVIGLAVGAVLALAVGWLSSAACSWVP